MNTKEVRALAFVALLALIAPAVLAGSYEEVIRQDIFLVRPDNEYLPEEPVTPTYLQEEDLTFFGCIDEKDTPLRLSVVCEDTNEFLDVDAYGWGPENCYMGSVNLDQLACSRAVVQAEYLQDGENRKIQQRIRINTFSDTLDRIVETQFSDGGWQNALDTAHGLFVLNQFPDLFEQRIADAIDYLKTNRHGKDKCWPKDDCQISTTANILFLLEKAGLEDLRIQHDAQLYLEREHNFLTSGMQWTVEITDHTINKNNTLNTSCVYEYDNTVESFTLPRHPTSVVRTLEPAYGNRIGVSCTEPVYVDLYNEYNETRINFQGDNFSHHIPPACWTRNNERINCDVRTTLFAAGTQIDNNQKSAARNYLSTLLVDDRTAGKHLEEDWTFINDALYAHERLTSTTDVLTALLYHQDNNGAWTSNTTYYEDTYYEPSDAEQEERPERINDTITRSIINTGYSVMGLLANGYDRDAEPIQDAERYVSLVEDETGLNASDEQLTNEEFAEEYEQNRTSILQDPKRNALAFVVLENNARPLLRTKPGILNVDQPNITLDIINPTIFSLDELEYELSDSLKNKLTVDEKDFVGAYSFRRLHISLDDTSTEDFGYLRITKNDNEYLKLPVIINRPPELEITLPEKLTVFGGSTTLPFKIKKSSHTFSCGLEWETPGISSSASFNINDAVNGSYNYPVRFSAVETENAVYNGTVTCQASGVTFKAPFATNIVRFSNRPLRVSPPAVTVNKSEAAYEVQVTNLLDEQIEVETTLRDQDPYVLINDPYVSLAPAETRNLSFEVIPPQLENYTASNSLVLKTFDVEERVLLDITIQPEPEQPISTWVWVVLATLLAALAGAGWIGYKRRDDLLEWYQERFNKENIKREVEKEIAQLEAKEEQSAIRNMIRIYKLQGLKDGEVRKRLLAEDYTEQEIDAAITGSTEAEEEPTPSSEQQTTQ